MGILAGIIRESWLLLFRMSIYLVMGFVFAGVIHQFLRPEFISRHLGKSSFLSVLKATLFGVPLPLCSCGVIPPAESLRVAGASTGAALAFLISTPTTGVDSILATYGMLGGIFTTFRILGAVLIGIVAGIMSNLFGGRSAGSCEISQANNGKISFDIREVFRYGFFELYPSIARWLFAGIIIGGFISYLLPEQAIPASIGTGWPAYFIMALIGTPLYVCATGSIPVAVSLISKGMSVGSGFVFLVVGPATNTVTMLFVWKFLGRRNLLIYLVSIVAGAILLGRVLDAIFLKYQFAVPAALHIHRTGSFILSLISSILLVCLGIFFFIQNLVRKKKVKGAHFCFIFSVPDISCQHCVRTIEKNLSRLAGVNSVRVDIKSKEVNVCCADDIPEQIKEVLEDAGYPVKSWERR